MGGVLIEEDKTAIGFENNVKFPDDAENSEGDFEERDGFRRRESDPRRFGGRFGSRR